MSGLQDRVKSASVSFSDSAFKRQLNKVYRWYTLAFFVFVAVLAVLEQAGRN